MQAISWKSVLSELLAQVGPLVLNLLQSLLSTTPQAIDWKALLSKIVVLALELLSSQSVAEPAAA